MAVGKAQHPAVVQDLGQRRPGAEGGFLDAADQGTIDQGLLLQELPDRFEKLEPMLLE
jgi:hypothetical protein